MLLFSRFFYLPTVTKKSMQAAPTKQGGTASRKRACVLTHRSAPVPRLAEVAQAREAMTAACITLSSVVGTVPHGTPSLVEFIGVPGRFSCSSKPPLHHTTLHYHRGSEGMVSIANSRSDPAAEAGAAVHADIKPVPGGEPMPTGRAKGCQHLFMSEPR
jgi:hypothetical protein